MMALVPEPWALLLLGLISLAILGVALYGTGAGLAGVLLGIEARTRPDRGRSIIRPDAPGMAGMPSSPAGLTSPFLPPSASA